MLRNFVSMAVLLGFLAVAGRAAEDKKSDEDKPDKPKAKAEDKKPDGEKADLLRPLMGKIKKIDADKGILVITSNMGKKPKDEELKIGDDTTFMIPGAGGKSTKGKAGLKGIKAGAYVQVMRHGKGGQMVVVMPMLGRPMGSGPAVAMGKVKKVDAEKGVVIIATGAKDDEKDKEIKITDDVTVMVFSSGEKPKRVSGKAILKEKDLLKAGAGVQVFGSPDGKTVIILGGFPTRANAGNPINPLNPSGRGIAGTIKKRDAEKGILVVTVGGKDVEIKSGDETKFMVAGSQPLTAREALKKDAFKEGTKVQVMKDKEGNITMVMITPQLKRPKIEE